jgi:hypothetical protein
VHSSGFYVKDIDNVFVESFPTLFLCSSNNRNHPIVLLQSTHLVIVGKQTSQCNMGRDDVCSFVSL